ncbi:hypothetical protein NPIL_302131 [Nephila pilipes]|uniref:Uncharacterized protein n=1 Tax=Nephila pilipes TaxID=299642 RepID=A0A8X6QWU2_NEPPI|nr:hypothetical protein NPIL_302131 [Nephila pilipes]
MRTYLKQSPYGKCSTNASCKSLPSPLRTPAAATNCWQHGCSLQRPFFASSLILGWQHCQKQQNASSLHTCLCHFAGWPAARQRQQKRLCTARRAPATFSAFKTSL